MEHLKTLRPATSAAVAKPQASQEHQQQLSCMHAKDRMATKCSFASLKLHFTFKEQQGSLTLNLGALHLNMRLAHGRLKMVRVDLDASTCYSV